VFEGSLSFPTAKGPSASATTVRVAWDEVSGTATVTGLPTLAGFTSPPDVFVSNTWGSDVRVTFSSGWNRPFELGGDVLSLDPSGTIRTKFYARAPAALTQKEFETYVADPKLGHPYHEVAIAWSDGTKGKLVIGREMGKIGDLVDSKGTTFPIGFVEGSPGRHIDAAPYRIDLPKPATGTWFFPGSDTLDEVVQQLLGGPMTCACTTPGKPVPTACTLTLTKTLFAAP
jgi:hypothetical protein